MWVRLKTWEEMIRDYPDRISHGFSGETIGIGPHYLKDEVGRYGGVCLNVTFLSDYADVVEHRGFSWNKEMYEILDPANDEHKLLIVKSKLDQ